LANGSQNGSELSLLTLFNNLLRMDLHSQRYVMLERQIPTVAAVGKIQQMPTHTGLVNKPLLLLLPL
jgi:hypothetical protein